MTSAASEIETRRAALAARDDRLAAVEAELKSRDLLIEKLKHQLAGLQRHRFGATSETLDPLQLRLEDAETGAAGETPAPRSAQASTKTAPNRRPLPDHLPRAETMLSPGVTCSTCGGALRRLGDDVTEELEYVPGRLVVNRVVRPRMACACCERITQAALPPRPIERGRPGPGLLAHVLVSKHADHWPLYRRSRIFEREGIDLAPSPEKLPRLYNSSAFSGGQEAAIDPMTFALVVRRSILSPQCGR